MRRLARLSFVILILSSLAFILGTLDTPDVEAQPIPVDDTNWAALYYPNTNFEDPLWLVTYDLGLNLDFGLLPPLVPDPQPDPNLTTFPILPGTPTATPLIIPLPGMPADGWSARYSTDTPFDAGIYEFNIVADGGVRMSVNGNVIIDDLGNQGLASFTGVAFLGSGLNELIVDYIDYSGNAIIQLTWRDITEEFFGTSLDDGDPNAVPPSQATAQVNAAVTGLALRSGPYLGASLVAVLRPGRDYQVVAQNNIEGEFTWYKLVINEQGQTGWASSRFLDVNLGNIITSDCSIPNDGGVTVAQSIVPNFSDANVARSCFGNIANVLNQSIGGGISTEQALGVANSCTAFALSTNSSFDAIVAFVDTAKLVFDIYGICGNGSCNVSNDLALEIAGLIAPGYAGTAIQAIVCFNALANIFDGQINNGQINDLINACSPLIIIPQNDPNAPIIVNLNQIYLNFINTVGSFICQTTSTPTITVPEESSVFDTLTLLPDTGVTLRPRSTMNIRVRPSTRTAEVGDLPWGDEAQVLARTVQAGEDHWYMIRYQGIIGWIDADFANVRGNISDVPIY
ncbi:MAG: SH3 domain-containing protein [Chloroflexota bacterium]